MPLLPADLQDARLAGANFQNAHLRGVNFQNADLRGINFQNVILYGANFQNADLRGTNFQNALLGNSNLGNTVFEPQPGMLPDIPSLALAENLEQMTYLESPHALVELREEFKKAGMRGQERKIIYAIERTKRQKEWDGPWGTAKIEASFKYLFFELTSKYGLLPGRPLRILVISLFFFAIPYAIAVGKAQNRAGIWVTASFIYKGKRKERMFLVKRHSTKHWKVRFVQWARLFCISFHFSLASAFHIGWRELNVGNWLTRLQVRDYTLSARGWARPLSGFQSIFSVYLIALSVLTYFGRPFE